MKTENTIGALYLPNDIKGVTFHKWNNSIPYLKVMQYKGKMDIFDILLNECSGPAQKLFLDIKDGRDYRNNVCEVYRPEGANNFYHSLGELQDSNIVKRLSVSQAKELNVKRLKGASIVLINPYLISCVDESVLSFWDKLTNSIPSDESMDSPIK